MIEKHFPSALLFGLSMVATGASADFVASRAALAGDDYIDWAQLGPPGLVDLPADVTSHLGRSAQLDNPAGDLRRYDQGIDYGGDFARGDALVSTYAGRELGGTLLIDFAIPVFGAGAQFQADLLGPYTGVIRGYDAAGALLESHTLAGVSASHGDGSALFFGIVRGSAEIDRIEFDLSPSVDFLTINRLSMLTAVPEPSTLAMLVAGGIGFALRRRQLAPS